MLFKWTRKCAFLSNTEIFLNPRLLNGSVGMQGMNMVNIHSYRDMQGIHMEHPVLQQAGV
jgi:hypothetical protein